MIDIQQAIRNVHLDENRERELTSALHVHFKDWLYGIARFPTIQSSIVELCLTIRVFASVPYAILGHYMLRGTLQLGYLVCTIDTW